MTLLGVPNAATAAAAITTAPTFHIGTTTTSATVAASNMDLSLGTKRTPTTATF